MVALLILAQLRTGLPTCANKAAPPATRRADIRTVPTLGKEKKAKKKSMVAFFFRIVKRELNLMRSMQQGISTHYNTRFGI